MLEIYGICCCNYFYDGGVAVDVCVSQSRWGIFFGFGLRITLVLGFWIKALSYREQPVVSFKNEYFIYVETDEDIVICSTIRNPTRYLQELDHCSSIKVTLKNWRVSSCFRFKKRENWFYRLEENVRFQLNAIVWVFKISIRNKFDVTVIV